MASGPGQLLKSTRESAGISIRDVSAQLRLDERTVAALEADDFSHLPAPTFVRGYLRGYARLLGVPVGPVMEAYDREGFAKSVASWTKLLQGRHRYTHGNAIAALAGPKAVAQG